MSRRPSTFRKKDLQRAIEGVQAAGVQVQQIEIDGNGKITVKVGSAAAAPASGDEPGWDNVR